MIWNRLEILSPPRDTDILIHYKGTSHDGTPFSVTVVGQSKKVIDAQGSALFSSDTLLSHKGIHTKQLSLTKSPWSRGLEFYWTEIILP